MQLAAGLFIMVYPALFGYVPQAGDGFADGNVEKILIDKNAYVNWICADGNFFQTVIL